MSHGLTRFNDRWQYRFRDAFGWSTLTIGRTDELSEAQARNLRDEADRARQGHPVKPEGLPFVQFFERRAHKHGKDKAPIVLPAAPAGCHTPGRDSRTSTAYRDGGTYVPRRY